MGGETKTLLPDNATPLERELSALSASLDHIDPSIIDTIWDAWRCPSPLLPWLAWQMSVDIWDESWSEVAKRAAIAGSPEYHRRKGTRRAIETALGRLGHPSSILEWFERTPPGRRGTFRVFVDLGDVPAPLRYVAGASVLRAARRLVAQAKPKSRAAAVGAGERNTGFLNVAAGVMLVRRVVIAPYRLIQSPADGTLTLRSTIGIARRLRLSIAPNITSATATAPFALTATLGVARTIKMEIA